MESGSAPQRNAEDRLLILAPDDARRLAAALLRLADELELDRQLQ